MRSRDTGGVLTQRKEIRAHDAKRNRWRKRTNGRKGRGETVRVNASECVERMGGVLIEVIGEHV